MKNWFILTLAAVMVLGCQPAAKEETGSTETSTTASHGSETKAPSGSVLDKVKSSGKVLIGIGQDAAPFGYRDNNELVGFEFDLTRAMVKHLKDYVGKDVEIEFVPVTDETRISWVQSGEVDLSACHTNNTRKRDENIDFSIPYFWDGKSVMYRVKDGPKDLKDFAGKTIGIKRSSSSEGEIKAYFEKQGWAAPVLKQYDNHAAGIQALMDGQVDGFTDDSAIIINTAVLAGNKVGATGDLVTTPTKYSNAYFGLGVRENDSDWRDAVNYALHDLWLSGEYQQIYEKWFGPNSNCPVPLGNNRMEPFVKG